VAVEITVLGHDFAIYRLPGILVPVRLRGNHNKDLSLTIDVMNFLSDRLKKHIMGTDKKYAPFFQEKGLK